MRIAIAILMACLVGLLMGQRQQRTGFPDRENYFWRLDSEVHQRNGYDETNPAPGSNFAVDTDYFYNTVNHSQIDSVHTFTNNNGFFETTRSHYVRTNFADYYQDDISNFSLLEGQASFVGFLSKRYDHHDNLILQEEYDDTMQILKKTLWVYDERDSLQSHVEYSYWDSEPVLTYDEHRFHDAEGRIIWSFKRSADFLTGTLYPIKECNYYYGEHSAADSTTVIHWAYHDEAMMVEHTYNSFGEHGNIIHSETRIYPGEMDYVSDQCVIRHVFTDYISSPIGYLPSSKFEYGAYIVVSYAYIGCYQDSLLTTYTYEDNFRQHSLYCQSLRFGSDYVSKVSLFNDAGLLISLVGNSLQYGVVSIFSDTYQWSCVSVSTENPIVAPQLLSISCGPNPFKEKIGIKFTSQAGQFEVSVYNIKGQLARTLSNGMKSSGDVYLDWDGTNELGAKLPSGVYIIKGKHNSGSVLAKVTLFQ